MDLEPDFFPHFPMEAFLGRFVRIDKTTGHAQFASPWVASSLDEKYAIPVISYDATDRGYWSKVHGITTGVAMVRYRRAIGLTRSPT